MIRKAVSTPKYIMSRSSGLSGNDLVRDETAVTERTSNYVIRQSTQAVKTTGQVLRGVSSLSAKKTIGAVGRSVWGATSDIPGDDSLGVKTIQQTSKAVHTAQRTISGTTRAIRTTGRTAKTLGRTAINTARVTSRAIQATARATIKAVQVMARVTASTIKIIAGFFSNPFAVIIALIILMFFLLFFYNKNQTSYTIYAMSSGQGDNIESTSDIGTGDGTLKSPFVGMNWRGVITSIFGVPRGDHNHSGLDIGMNQGTPINACMSGVVSLSGWNGGYGNCVIVTNGIYSVYYAHQVSLPPVYIGQRINVGDVVGYVGNTGNSFGAHLHLELRIRGIAVDPLLYLE